ncbi:hypothetical protein [Flavobacterium terrigena]|uniref:Lipoprotein n=1 Tax=Flavobacterium terrigena TaxID=402734 RepID=A0A1H6U4Y9_9FLAO|nr:hypothetical protein [Flavobacterium terrigena]SEI83435.1 hypothetical protein SAMN05660918_1761 [Flavobacterium terrigena]
MNKVIKIALFSLVLAIVSCSSGDTVEASDDTNPTTPTVAMTTEIDGVDYDTPPQIGGNLAENSGGASFGGSDYYLLKGYKNLNTSKSAFKVGNKIFNIYLAIPKNDLSVGTHSFSSTFTTGDYYADLDISGVIPAENVNTISGSINVLSYDASTRLLKGTFVFTTDDGVNLVDPSHFIVGSFEYKLP